MIVAIFLVFNICSQIETLKLYLKVVQISVSCQFHSKRLIFWSSWGSSRFAFWYICIHVYILLKSLGLHGSWHHTLILTDNVLQNDCIIVCTYFVLPHFRIDSLACAVLQYILYAVSSGPRYLAGPLPQEILQVKEAHRINTRISFHVFWFANVWSSGLSVEKELMNTDIFLWLLQSWGVVENVVNYIIQYSF